MSDSKLYMGSINVDNIYMGESPVDAIYLGSNLIYTAEEPVQPVDEIWYTTIDGETIELFDESAFNANLISNTYQGGKGVLRFDDVVTEIYSQAFMNCANLQTLKLPDSITSIGMFAFSDCYNLAEIVVESTTPCDLEGFAFDGSNEYPIYVPCESLNDYLDDDDWGVYADRIDCKQTPQDLSLMGINGEQLSTRSAANCYVIKSTGYYILPLVYGNAITNGEINASSYTQIEGENTQPFFNYLNNQITSPYIETDTGVSAITAEIMYSDVPTSEFSIRKLDIIEKDSLKYLAFKVNKFPSLGGNAVIAVKDSNGLVMWSWHIWAYEDTLSTKTYTNTNGVSYDLLEVNLGWVKDSEDSKYGTNTYYQWGRKDPMLRAANSSSNIDATVGYGSWSATTVASSLGQTIQNPNCQYFAGLNSNWWQNGDEAVVFYNYWDASETTEGASDKSVIKTVYDPCPVGFSVPCGNVLLGCTKENGGTFDKGFVWSGRYFPAVGYRLTNRIGVAGLGTQLQYFPTASYSTTKAIYMGGNVTNFYASGLAIAKGIAYTICPTRIKPV